MFSSHLVKQEKFNEFKINILRFSCSDYELNDNCSDFSRILFSLFKEIYLIAFISADLNSTTMYSTLPCKSFNILINFVFLQIFFRWISIYHKPLEKS